MSAYVFVTGVGTGVGKTVITRGLARALVHHGLLVTAVKPIETGVRDVAEDAVALSQACKQPHLSSPKGLYRARAPLAPYAATLEGEPPAPDAVTLSRRIVYLSEGADLVLVEGAGGLLVPTTREETTADLAAELRAALLIVAPDSLGVLSNVLALVESARARELDILGTVLVESDALFDDPSVRTNARILEELTGAFVVKMPRVPNVSDDDVLGGAVEATGLPTKVLDALKALAVAPQHLLTVEHVFATRGGVMVSPEVSLEVAGSVELRVELRLPDGSSLRAQAIGAVSMPQKSQLVGAGLRHMLTIHGVREDQVPLGTQVWLLTE